MRTVALCELCAGSVRALCRRWCTPTRFTARSSCPHRSDSGLREIRTEAEAARTVALSAHQNPATLGYACADPRVGRHPPPLSEWGRVLHDEDMVAAILDRATFPACVAIEYQARGTPRASARIAQAAGRLSRSAMIERIPLAWHPCAGGVALL